MCPYFKTFGTFYTPNKSLEKNQHYFQYAVEEDDIFDILNAVKPDIIISAIRGDFSSQVLAHTHLVDYLKTHPTKLIFLSASNVFDAYSKFPSYELDKTFSNSIYGHFKIKIENKLLKLPKKQIAIIRLPMVFGAQSPRIKMLKLQLTEKLPIEVFPNLVINVTNDTRITQQIHYIINRKKHGIFHLGSKDLVHHDDFIKEISASMGYNTPILKQVFTTNDHRYLAVLSKQNPLPKHLQLTSEELIKELTH